MSNYTEESKKIYNEVCDKYKHHWLDTTVTQTMAMEMITKALAISRVVGQSEQLVCPECKSNDCKTAIHTDYKECNKCYHYWEAN